MSAFKADALIASPSWKSMARTVLLSRRVLKSPFGSFSWAPFGNVSLTAFLRASPMQTMPSWDQTGTPLGSGGLLPLHLFDYARVGAPDESPQLTQPVTPPAGHPADDVIYLLGRGCVAHADALLRLLSTERTAGLSSLSLRWMQPSQQHGRRFPSSSSDCNRRMCWLLVSAFFGQSTQQIHSLRARGVRSCHAARTFGLAIRTRLRSSGTVCTTPPETTVEPIDRPS